MRVSGGPVVQTQTMMAGGRYLSHCDTELAFACGAAPEVNVEVVWPDGRRTFMPRVAAGSRVEVKAADAARPEPGVIRPVVTPLFEDLSNQLGHVHRDEPSREFQRQPLLPLRLGSLGPGVAWVSSRDGDFDELWVGGGTGGELHHGLVGTNRGTGVRLSQDQHGMAFWWESGEPRMAVAISNWESVAGLGQVVTVSDPGGSFRLDLPPQRGTAGPVAVADFDGDGDVDFFVGFMAYPGRWPEAPPSVLLRRQGNDCQVIPLPGDALPVMGAVFTDLTGDGLPELVTTCDRGPIRVFQWIAGQWKDTTGAWGLQAMRGWWRGVVSGDFDGDGRMDLAAANWGLNFGSGIHGGGPMRWEMRYADWVGDDTVQTLVGAWSESVNRVVPVRERRAVLAVFPELIGIAPTHVAWGNLGLSQVADAAGPRHRRVQAEEFRSLVLLNRGGSFDIKSLPAEAQRSPAFGVAVSDFDGNGTEDLFLSQNFFGTDPESSRHDAGTGLVLLGNGDGSFRALSPMESGLFIEGEGRGSAVGDFDGDLRPDLVVAQHQGATRLMRNRSGRPGVRLRLRGPSGNSGGIGAVVRLRCGNQWGAAREVRSGSGWWSQDSLQPILASPGTPEELEVRWPGGKTTRSPVTPNPRGVISASFPGE